MDWKILRTIDVEIRDIIRDLNELSFVYQTLFSCAGYGKAGEGERHPNEYEDDPYDHLPRKNGLYMGYVLMALDKSVDGKDFDKAMTEISDKRVLNVYWRDTFKRRGYDAKCVSYEFWGTPKQLKKKWNTVRELLDVWLVEG